MSPPDIRVMPIERLELSFEPKPWAYADARRAEIDAYFSALQREKPALWNGRVLLLHRQAVSEGVFRGAYLETDYASFAAWKHWGWAPSGVHDCFASAAILAADGAFLLGVMGAHTLHAGDIYFPSGTPDPGDIIDGRVDLDFSVRREIKEETGLDAADLHEEPGWTTVADGALIAQIKVFRARLDGERLREDILRRLAQEQQPEFADIRIVRGEGDFDAAMPRFVTAFLRHYWRAR
jgi:8-oxo-dGTP pyrophosphatase MutT (NUDIX family)